MTSCDVVPTSSNAETRNSYVAAMGSHVTSRDLVCGASAWNARHSHDMQQDLGEHLWESLFCG